MDDINVSRNPPKNASSGRFFARDKFAVVMLAGTLFLGAISFVPNLVASQRKAKVSRAKSNMHTAQLAVETFATDCAGRYPVTVEEAKKCLLRYCSTDSLSEEQRLKEFAFVLGADVGCRSAQDVRNGKLFGRLNVRPGKTVFLILGPTTYAVFGVDSSGKNVAGNAGNLLVLSNG